ncbi:MAG: BglG family transcription antiterminator [Peptoniphilaceae bacterium]|nr:BglG family transcription antiterminator [Peptoniphilaceae bacterium]
MKKSWSIEDILAKLNISERTFHYDIKLINKEIEKYKIKISKYYKGNYYLKFESKNDLYNLLNYDIFSDILENPEVEIKIYYLCLKFLFAKDYIKFDDLIDDMYVSRSTIKNYMKKARLLFKKYDISIETRPNYGQKIVGNERNIRKLISYLINKINEKNLNNYDFEKLFLLDRDKFETIYEIVLKNIFDSKIKMSDIALSNLVVHILIAIKRIEMKQYISKNIDNEIKNSKEYLIALNIVNDIYNKLNIEFPNDEVYYISMHLMGINLSIVKNNSYSKMSEFEKVYSEILKELKNQLGIDFKNDLDLKNSVFLHLKPAIYRFKNKIKIDNPLKNSIKTNYPLAYEAGVITSKIIKDKLNIEFNEDELCYISMHFGVAIVKIKSSENIINAVIVCTTGMGSARLIEYKIKSKFQNKINVVAVTELYNLINIEYDKVDLIISTVPFKYKGNIDVIYLQDILGDSSLKQISDYLDKKTIKRSEYLDIDDIYVNLNFSTKEELLHFIVNDLNQKGKAPISLYDFIIERENIASTAFGNMVAIPHPIKFVTDKTFISIATLKKEILWNDKYVKLVILLNLSKNSKELLEEMYKVILDVIDNQTKVDEIVNCKNKNEIYSKFIK